MLSKAEQLKKNGTLRPKPYKNKDYLAWLHNQWFGCLVCGNTNIEVHHLDHGNRGRRDDKCVPLCVEHHRGKFSPHGANAKQFYEAHNKEVLEAVADRLFNQYKERNDNL